MLSALVTAHQKSMLFVLSSLESNLQRIVAAFVALFCVNDQESKRVSAALEVIVAVVTRRARAVLGVAVDADQSLAKERSDDAGLAARRDSLVATVREHVIRLRAVMEGVFGPKVFNTLGVKGDTPDEVVALTRFARAVLNGIRSTPLPAPVAGTSFDIGPFVAGLSPAVSELEGVLEAINADARENQAALMERDRALAESRKVFALVATFTSALLALAGLDELAGRVRPTGKRPGTVADESEVTGTTSGPEAA